MDAQKFLAEFGVIANAPGGVTRLRELILALAVQGRLVSQDESEEPAIKQLERIKTIAQSRPATGRRKKAVATIHRGSQESSQLPQGWVSTRLCDLVRVLNGRAYSKAELLEAGTPVLRVGNLFTSNRWYFSNLELDEDKYCDAGDLLFAWSASFGPFIWRGGRVIYHYHIWKLDLFSSEEINKSFLYTWLLEKTQEIKASGHGISMAHMTKEKFEQLEISIPPLEEQFRIVAKVDELIALCDQLEAQQQERLKLQNSLRQSTLQAVASATSPYELQATWARLADNFGQLFHTPEDVDVVVAELKNLAVRGLLAEASVALPDLDVIKADCSQLRAQYITDGLMRRQKLVGMAECEEIYPDHWAVTAFDEVAVVIGGVTKGRDLRGKQVMVCPYLAVANVQRGHFKLEGLKSIEIAAEELAKYQIHEGDLLITEGGDWDKVGRTAIWRGGVANCLHQNHVFKARVPSGQLLNEWVELVFNSGIGRDYFAGASKQTTNLASINMTQVRSFALPIPPLDEQQRILSALSELTTHCNKWRRQLERKQALSALLAGAVVSSFTGIAIEQDEEPMKAPQTELIAPLRLGTAPDIKAQAPLATTLARHNGEMSAKDLWQRFGGEIDAFYAQLKTEVACGWILEPTPAEMREKSADTVSA
ncbi:type I restriction endonuclease EcoAI subunit S [Pseudomonas straminea]|uniref:Type I restriction enzyme, S subunit n=1 Tax=Pseudomonas straminea TaxID=47882 RepID=A0A1I1SW84_PSEOC|nr:restriction endonuclease subunit S [Pseudomonas straminea]GLX12653.1 type I restriction endonuclease EcoAI subunit S [Pseudomonas straminea]SFD50734.1 type I restriction enzyme, S subunit [Pseudomonas straminea]